MTYRVVIPQTVLDAIDSHLRYLRREGAPAKRVDAWLDRLASHIDSLAELPRRCPVAEAVTAAVGYEVRRLKHGDYAVFYRIDERARVVEIMAFRHGRQRPWLEEG